MPGVCTNQTILVLIPIMSIPRFLLAPFTPATIQQQATMIARSQKQDIQRQADWQTGEFKNSTGEF
jgi:hypothetical protein